MRGVALLCLLALAGCASGHAPSGVRHTPGGVKTVNAPPRYDADRLMAALPASFHGLSADRSPATVADLGPPHAGPLDQTEVDRPQCRAPMRGGQIWQFLHSAAVATATPVATMDVESAGVTLIALPDGTAASAVTTPTPPDPACATFHVKVDGAWRTASVRVVPTPDFGTSREVVREFPAAYGKVVSEQLLYAGHDYVALVWMNGPTLKGVTFDAFAHELSAHIGAALK